MTSIQVMTFSVALGDLGGKAPKQKPWWPLEKFISLSLLKMEGGKKKIEKKYPFTEVVTQWVICCLTGDGAASLSVPQWFDWLLLSAPTGEQPRPASLMSGSCLPAAEKWVAMVNNILLVWAVAFACSLCQNRGFLLSEKLKPENPGLSSLVILGPACRRSRLLGMSRLPFLHEPVPPYSSWLRNCWGDGCCGEQDAARRSPPQGSQRLEPPWEFGTVQPAS